MAMAVAALTGRAAVTEAVAALAARAPVTTAVAALTGRATVTVAVAALAARTAVTVSGSPVPVLTASGPRRGGDDRLTAVAFVLLAVRSAPMPPKPADDRPDGGPPVARGDAAAGGQRAASAGTGARAAV
jgi:hypothetical protein